jgi:putative aldouronate transport system permease protein
VPLFIGGTVVTHYLIIAKAGLLDNFLVYVIPASFSFFNMVIMRTFIEQIPDSLEESATIDGAGYYSRFWRIVLPLSKPVLAVFLFFGVVHAWLDFRTNLLYVTRRSLNVLQFVLYEIVIQSQSKDFVMDFMGNTDIQTLLKTSSAPRHEVLKMATLVVVTFPIFFVYPFFQKYFIRGIMVGAIKA